ncbi:MAG: transcriptional regulator [Oscillospiraceae bacterium]|nr:transcriptional regulator [Oscillospiraceae bacterium]
MSSTVNDFAWRRLFEKYDILHHVDVEGSFRISADQIREFREPRLMVKFDHSINLPKLFAENNLAILPITRGDYVISHFDAYHSFEETNEQVIRVQMPSYIQSLDSSNIPSEAIALNCAVASGIIADFMEDSDILATVSGRMGSGSFSFRIGDLVNGNTHQIDVSNSQIEIDAAYEGVESLALLEAKRDLSDDFLIRQLYYPFRVWTNRITKPVRPIFLVYTNGIYRLYEYTFEDTQNYSSLRLVKQRNYSVEDTAISASDIQDVLNSVQIVEEPKIAFPQADKFERIINLCELVSENKLSRNDVTEQYAFDARQTNYYTDAARYLGLLDKSHDKMPLVYSISDKCREILNLDYKKRQLEFCKCILSHRAFNETLRQYFRNGAMPPTKDILGIMIDSGLYNINSMETFKRRASTIKGWLNWIVSLISE